VVETIGGVPAERLAICGKLFGNFVGQLRLGSPGAESEQSSEPALPAGHSAEERARRCSTARCAWHERFYFRDQRRENGHVVEGLRHPQMGGLCAALAHWKVTDEPATIVMPTGSGKTETMLAIFFQQRLERLLVVVPTGPLRTQTAEKFITLGILKKARVIAEDAPYPVVGVLEHGFKNPEEVAEFFASCNVVVSTMALIQGCTAEVQQAMALVCSHLFIDEAHHIQAPTWKEFRRHFSGKPILQFTATPYRTDGQHVDGKIIFNYPLKKAQEEGYFQAIDFLPVREYDSVLAEEAIARKAIGRLKKDLAAGLDHIVMARAATIERAKEIYQVYRRLGAAHNPVLIHSGQNTSEVADAFFALRQRTSRIAVCVNMLGEGFDLPELKIAALHDVHKSLAPTLQFIGRFARTKPTIGNATVVANIEEASVAQSLRRLYAEESDWNEVLRTLSEGATGRELATSEFLQGFADVPPDISLLNVSPKMSTVVYRTNCEDWRPGAAESLFSGEQLCAKPAINQQKRVMLFITREREPVVWGDIKELVNLTWDLYLVHWDEERKLLFINSSNNDTVHRELAEAVAGENAELIRGEQVYRSLYGVNRKVVMNLGLKHAYSRFVQFTWHAGSDIGRSLAQPYLKNKSKSNMFVRGYENGDRTSRGCSGKGRIWSASSADGIAEWVDWCWALGTKLLDDSIPDGSAFAHVMFPRTVTAPPDLYPIAIEWPEDFLLRSDDAVRLHVGGKPASLHDVDFALVQPGDGAPLKFQVFTETSRAIYEIQFKGGRVHYLPVGNEAVDVRLSRKTVSLTEWFQSNPPTIRYANGAYLEYNLLFEERDPRQPAFEMERIQAWDWEGTNITKESQTYLKYEHSIQRRVIRELLREDHDPPYDIVFDDDDSGEAADIVAAAVVGSELVVHFFHCKFSSENYAGARVEDLYEVCGQAQRSAFWRPHFRVLADHMKLRDADRRKAHHVSRFERGDLAKLSDLRRQSEMLEPRFKAYVVQPGLSKAKLEKSSTRNNQLELLGATELYLRETYELEFGVIANK
jgi:superfamily II DNA or RNA helicase